MSLAISLRSEFYKNRRTAIGVLCGIAASIAPIFSLMDGLSDYRIPELKADPWNLHLVGMGPRILNMMVLPFFTMLVCTLQAQLEYRNHTWKQLYVSPQRLGHVFLAKFLVIQSLLLGVILLNGLLMTLSLYVVDRKADLGLNHHSLNRELFWGFWTRMYLTVLPISAVQFWLGLRFRSFITPLVAGISLYLLATVLMEKHQWTQDYLYPYLYPLRNSFPKSPTEKNVITLGALLYTFLLLALGYLDFKRRRSTGA